MMGFLFNVLKGILLIDIVFLTCVSIQYLKKTKQEEKELQESVIKLTSIIEIEVKNVYHNTRNNFILRNVKEVYEYEQVLLDTVHKEIIRLKQEGQLELSKYLMDYEIQSMIKYEINKIGIRIDKRDNRIHKKEEKSKQTTVDISDSLML